MIINKIQKNEKIIIAIDGRLDTTTSPQLQDVLIPLLEDETQVEIDFTQLVYVSSAGLRVLLMGQKVAKANGASMTVTGISEEIMEVFDMTGFSDMLTIVRNKLEVI